MPGWPGTSQELYFLELLKFYWAYRRKCFPSLFLDFSRVFKIPHKNFFFSWVTIDWNTQVLYSTSIQIILPHFKVWETPQICLLVLEKQSSHWTASSFWLLSLTLSSDHRHKGQEVSCIWKESPSSSPHPFLLPRSCPDVNLIGSVRSQTAEVLDPLPDLPISSRRNSANESLWGTDAARAAGRKTTCHTHLMITHTKAVMSRSAFVCACLCILESHCVGYCKGF